MLLGSMDRTYGLMSSSNGVAPRLEFDWYIYYFVQYWFSRKYRSSWKFLPCNVWGQPRDLAALVGSDDVGRERVVGEKGSSRRVRVVRKQDSCLSFK